MKQFFSSLSKTDVRNIIAIIYVLLVLGFIYVLVFKPVPNENKDLVNVLGGVVIGGIGPIIGFYYGSSKSDNHLDSK
jgi:hypothetical protein